MISRKKILGAIAGLAVLAMASSGASAATLPAELDRALRAAVSRADPNVLAAAVVDAIGQNPALVSEIVRAATRLAPAYSITVSRDAAAAFPAFAPQITAAAGHSTPEKAATIAAVAGTAPDGPVSDRKVPSPGRLKNPSPWPGWDVTLGFGFGIEPTYEGDDETEIVPKPLIDISWRDRAFLTTDKNRGLGVNMLRGRQSRFGAYLTIDWGREEDDAARLAGTGDIDPSPEIGLFGEFFTQHWRFSLDAVQGFNRDGQDGMLFTFAGEFGGQVTERLAVTIEGSTAYGGENYMRTYFGVNQNQSARSGHAVFLPEAGFKDVTGAVSFHYTFSPHWFAISRGEWKRLIGDADTSPLVDPDAENQVSATFVAGYRF